MQGWAGKILAIDLTSGAIETRPLDMTMARLFLGGRGLGARLLWDLVGPEVEPLSPRNVLIFTTGPLTSQALPTLGTAAVLNVINDIGVLPTHNFQQSQFEGAERISGEYMTEHLLVRNQACWACPIACTRVTRTAKAEGEGPEYEATWAFGAQCGIDQLEAIAEANYLCNDLGLDTISTGGTIACAMEMAEGSHRFAEAHGAPALSMSAKKPELPAYDPRGMQGQGLRHYCHPVL
jgi:aldehyde:ferredoxin oxidoreductase